jgi:methyltransferase family protein
MKRVVTAELLDTDSGTPAEIAASLGDLRRINRWFGGIATTEEMVDRVASTINASSLSLLEVAAGSGYVPEIARQRLQRRGMGLQITLLDRALSHLNNGSRADAGDALVLPFRGASFDLLSCNLFAHHLSPEELQQFVDEALRVCRVAVLINDLVRIGCICRWCTPACRSTAAARHDAPASVRQAYTPEDYSAWE